MHFDIHWHESLPSTNTHLREWAAREAALTEGTVVAARAQDAGRGRRGRTWHCVPNRDLAFSLLLRPQVEMAALPSLPLCAALAVADAVATLGIDAQIKWPNDLRRGGRKLSGILIESVPGAPSPTLVVGIGINVNATADDLADIDQPATSLSIETGHALELTAVLDTVLGTFAARYETWQTQGFAALRDTWIERAEGIGQKVSIRDGDNTRTGVMEGIAKDGALLLRDASGGVQRILAGDLLY